MSYLRSKNLGFDRDRVLAVRLRSPDVIRNIESVKQDLLRDPDILGAAAASSPLGLQSEARNYVPEGFDGNPIMVRTLFVDHDFIPALGMTVAAGRAFSREFPTDASTALVINRTAQAVSAGQAVGKTITFMIAPTFESVVRPGDRRGRFSHPVPPPGGRTGHPAHPARGRPVLF
jgi:putative ABC transport system permease protein